MAARGGSPPSSSFVLHWYAVDDTGRFSNRKGVLQRLKGWGKDPLVAVRCLVELVGPSRFSHWGADGEPVGVPHPQAWVQIAAVSRDQTRNTMTLLPALMSDRFIETFDIKPGAELIRANGGRQRLEAVTSSYRALEGGAVDVRPAERDAPLGARQQRRPDVRDHRRQRDQDGCSLPRDHQRLPARRGLRRRTDARSLGQDRRRHGAVDIGFVYDCLEAHPATPLTPEALRIVLPKIRGDAVWLNVESIIQSVLDLTLRPVAVAADVAQPDRRPRKTIWLSHILRDHDGRR